MSNNKRPLIPSFLQKLDERLMRNNPTTWQARTHLVLFFAALFAVVLSLFCLLVFFDARQYSTLSGWVTFTGLIVFIGFVFWLIFLLRFNVFKRFGNWGKADGLKSFLLYFVSIAAMVAVCFIPSGIETYRANLQFGNEEIVNDINELNATACKLEYDLLPKQWSADTCKVVDTLINAYSTEEVAVQADTAVMMAVDRLHRIDTAELQRKLEVSDSTLKLNDSLYIFFECPNYQFVSSYKADAYTKTKQLRSAELYRSIIPGFKRPDKVALSKRMDELKKKWAVNSWYGNYYSVEPDDYNPNDDYKTKINKKYSLYNIGNGIDNAASKKYEWKENWSSYLRVFYYITLILTLLVFIFRHTTVKTFFLSLLTAVVVAIFTGLFMLTSYESTETTLLSFMILYYVVFAIIALSIFGASVRRAAQGIALNLFVFMTPFIPLLFAALNEAMHRYDRYANPYYIKEEERNTAMYFVIAEFAGAILLLVLLEPLFKKLYRKWFAAPEN